MNKKERKTVAAGARDSAPRISYAGGCFAWPRQYYYHIFRIMRSHVCLLFYVTLSRAIAVRREVGNMMHFNVLSFRCSSRAFFIRYLRCIEKFMGYGSAGIEICR